MPACLGFSRYQEKVLAEKNKAHFSSIRHAERNIRHFAGVHEPVPKFDLYNAYSCFIKCLEGECPVTLMEWHLAT